MIFQEEFELKPKSDLESRFEDPSTELVTDYEKSVELFVSTGKKTAAELTMNVLHALPGVVLFGNPFQEIRRCSDGSLMHTYGIELSEQQYALMVQWLSQ